MQLSQVGGFVILMMGLWGSVVNVKHLQDGPSTCGWDMEKDRLLESILPKSQIWELI